MQVLELNTKDYVIKMQFLPLPTHLKCCVLFLFFGKRNSFKNVSRFGATHFTISSFPSSFACEISATVFWFRFYFRSLIVHCSHDENGWDFREWLMPAENVSLRQCAQRRNQFQWSNHCETILLTCKTKELHITADDRHCTVKLIATRKTRWRRKRKNAQLTNWKHYKVGLSE